MKIKPCVNKNVSTAVQNCREVLVTETVGLLKQIGAGQDDDVLLKRILFLFQTKADGKTETIVCDRIGYAGREGSTPYYIISMGDKDNVRPVSDMFLSLSNLQTIYEEVRRVVRDY